MSDVIDDKMAFRSVQEEALETGSNRAAEVMERLTVVGGGEKDRSLITPPYAPVRVMNLVKRVASGQSLDLVEMGDGLRLAGGLQEWANKFEDSWWNSKKPLMFDLDSDGNGEKQHQTRRASQMGRAVSLKRISKKLIEAGGDKLVKRAEAVGIDSRNEVAVATWMAWEAVGLYFKGEEVLEEKDGGLRGVLEELQGEKRWGRRMPTLYALAKMRQVCGFLGIDGKSVLTGEVKKLDGEKFVLKGGGKEVRLKDLVVTASLGAKAEIVKAFVTQTERSSKLGFPMVASIEDNDDPRLKLMVAGVGNESKMGLSVSEQEILGTINQLQEDGRFGAPMDELWAKSIITKMHLVFCTELDEKIADIKGNFGAFGRGRTLGNVLESIPHLSKIMDWPELRGDRDEVNGAPRNHEPIGIQALLKDKSLWARIEKENERIIKENKKRRLEGKNELPLIDETTIAYAHNFHEVLFTGRDFGWTLGEKIVDLANYYKYADVLGFGTLLEPKDLNVEEKKLFAKMIKEQVAFAVGMTDALSYILKGKKAPSNPRMQDKWLMALSGYAPIYETWTAKDLATLEEALSKVRRKNLDGESVPLDPEEIRQFMAWQKTGFYYREQLRWRAHFFGQSKGSMVDSTGTYAGSKRPFEFDNLQQVEWLKKQMDWRGLFGSEDSTRRFRRETLLKTIENLEKSGKSFEEYSKEDFDEVYKKNSEMIDFKVYFDFFLERDAGHKRMALQMLRAGVDVSVMGDDWPKELKLLENLKEAYGYKKANGLMGEDLSEEQLIELAGSDLSMVEKMEIVLEQKSAWDMDFSFEKDGSREFSKSEKSLDRLVRYYVLYYYSTYKTVLGVLNPMKGELMIDDVKALWGKVTGAFINMGHAVGQRPYDSLMAYVDKFNQTRWAAALKGLDWASKLHAAIIKAHKTEGLCTQARVWPEIDKDGELDLRLDSEKYQAEKMRLTKIDKMHLHERADSRIVDVVTEKEQKKDLGMMTTLLDKYGLFMYAVKLGEKRVIDGVHPLFERARDEALKPMFSMISNYVGQIEIIDECKLGGSYNWGKTRAMANGGLFAERYKEIFGIYNWGSIGGSVFQEAEKLAGKKAERKDKLPEIEFKEATKLVAKSVKGVKLGKLAKSVAVRKILKARDLSAEELGKILEEMRGRFSIGEMSQQDWMLLAEISPAQESPNREPSSMEEVYERMNTYGSNDWVLAARAYNKERTGNLIGSVFKGMGDPEREETEKVETGELEVFTDIDGKKYYKNMPPMAKFFLELYRKDLRKGVGDMIEVVEGERDGEIRRLVGWMRRQVRLTTFGAHLIDLETDDVDKVNFYRLPATTVDFNKGVLPYIKKMYESDDQKVRDDLMQWFSWMDKALEDREGLQSSDRLPKKEDIFKRLVDAVNDDPLFSKEKRLSSGTMMTYLGVEEIEEVEKNGGGLREYLEAKIEADEALAQKMVKGESLAGEKISLGMFRFIRAKMMAYNAEIKEEKKDESLQVKMIASLDGGDLSSDQREWLQKMFRSKRSGHEDKVNNNVLNLMNLYAYKINGSQLSLGDKQGKKWLKWEGDDLRDFGQERDFFISLAMENLDKIYDARVGLGALKLSREERVWLKDNLRGDKGQLERDMDFVGIESKGLWLAQNSQFEWLMVDIKVREKARGMSLTPTEKAQIVEAVIKGITVEGGMKFRGSQFGELLDELYGFNPENLRRNFVAGAGFNRWGLLSASIEWVVAKQSKGKIDLGTQRWWSFIKTYVVPSPPALITNLGAGGALVAWLGWAGGLGWWLGAGMVNNPVVNQIAMRVARWRLREKFDVDLPEDLEKAVYWRQIVKKGRK